MEWWFLKWVHLCLTDLWPTIQGGVDLEALNIWLCIFQVLELDEKSQIEFLLLAQTSEHGRASANEILWNLLSWWALLPEYEDLSSITSKMILKTRKGWIDRPPRDSLEHRRFWCWGMTYVPRRRHWSPMQVPRGDVSVRTSDDGTPIPPPENWVEDL